MVAGAGRAQCAQACEGQGGDVVGHGVRLRSRSEGNPDACRGGQASGHDRQRVGRGWPGCAGGCPTGPGGSAERKLQATLCQCQQVSLRTGARLVIKLVRQEGSGISYEARILERDPFRDTFSGALSVLEKAAQGGVFQ